MITAEDIARRLRGLDDIGTGPDGVTRLAWSDEDEACRLWFVAQARELELEVERDPAGNMWATPRVDPPWWAIGSHLDSVRAGGRFDGPLGVACGFEIAARASQPLAVLSFADEEGARWGTPTFGSKALAGKLDVAAVVGRRDDQGVELGEAMRARRLDPELIGDASQWLDRLAGFVEIHIDQTTDLARAGSAVGVVTALAHRRRLEVEINGRADHAGTTPTGERRDALATAAHLIVSSEQLAERAQSLRVTASRIVVEPNAPTTIAAHVRLWLDARAPEAAAIDEWQRAVTEVAASMWARTGVEIEVRVASRSDGVEFSPPLRAELLGAAEAVLGEPAPEVLCFAGHDAGVLADRIPAAMVFVRNAAGVSHSPEEWIELDDAAAAANAVLATVEKVARR